MAYYFGNAVEVVSDFLNAHTTSEYMPMKKLLVEDLQVAAEGFGADRPVSGVNSKFIAYLISRVNKKASKITFNDIDLTKGNVTKWSKYENIVKLISLHSKFAPDDLNDKNSAYSKLVMINEFVVNQRADFEFGYKTSNDFITLTYRMLLIAMMTYASASMISQIKGISSFNTGKITNRKYNKLLKYSDKYISMFFAEVKAGSWAKIVKKYKDTRLSPRGAMEAVGEVMSIIATVALIGAVGAISLVAIISAIRGIIYLYYNTLAKIDDQARSMEEYLNQVIPYETNPQALKKQEAAVAKLNSIAGFIEAKLIKADSATETEIKSEDSKVTVDMIENSTGNSYDFM